MKFALIYQVQLPKPWTDVSEYQLFQNILTQVSFAEEMGFELARRHGRRKSSDIRENTTRSPRAPRVVVPKPLQKPHPPLWGPATRKIRPT